MRIFIKTILYLILLIVFYNWGYICGERSVLIQLFDQSLMSISSNIVFKDSIETNSEKTAEPLVLARIESDIKNIVTIYNEHHFDYAEIGRCAVTRRVRKLVKQKEIFSDKNQLSKNGYPIDEVVSYLEKECLGEPSKDNWTK